MLVLSNYLPLLNIVLLFLLITLIILKSKKFIKAKQVIKHAERLGKLNEKKIKYSQFAVYDVESIDYQSEIWNLWNNKALRFLLESLRIEINEHMTMNKAQTNRDIAYSFQNQLFGLKLLEERLFEISVNYEAILNQEREEENETI